MNEAQRSWRRRRLTWTLVLALLVAGAGWAIGAGVPHSLLLGLAVAAVGATLVALDLVDDEPRLPPEEQLGRNAGARREIARLSWAMAGGDQRVGEQPYRRLRAVVAARLAGAGIDPSDPAGEQAARELLGPTGYAQLVAVAPGPPTRRVFESCLTLVERMGHPADAPGRPGAVSVASPGAAGSPNHPDSASGPASAGRRTRRDRD